MYEIDKKDAIILDLLQKNCRMSLTEISKHVHLSVDSVKKRINKMLENRIFYPKIQLRPRNFGFPNVVDVKIKLQYSSEQEMEALIAYLKSHPNVIEIFSVSGEWDLTMVIIAKDAIDLGKITAGIRNRFGKIITSWNASLTVNSYKFEDYKMAALTGD